MKHLFALILLAAAWYFAGMNQQKPVMAVIICAVIITVISFIYSVFMRFRTDASIPAQNDILYKNADSPLKLSVENRSRLPVNRVALTVTMQYAADKRKTKKRLKQRENRSQKRQLLLFLQ